MDPVDLDTPEGLTKALLEDAVTLADLKGLSADDLELVYAEAYEKLVDGGYADALDDLLLLVTHNPWDERFQFAYGLALQFLGQHEGALPHYAQALLFDATNAGCVLRMGECFDALGQSEEAAEAMRTCIELSWVDLQWEAVRRQAEATLLRIESRREVP